MFKISQRRGSADITWRPEALTHCPFTDLSWKWKQVIILSRGGLSSAQSTILHSDPEGVYGQKIGTIDCAEVRAAADSKINLRL